MIELYRSGNTWVARYTGTEAVEVHRLFGTDVLPTAFTAHADARTVCAEIQAANPASQVVLRPAKEVVPSA